MVALLDTGDFVDFHPDFIRHCGQTEHVIFAKILEGKWDASKPRGHAGWKKAKAAPKKKSAELKSKVATPKRRARLHLAAGLAEFEGSATESDGAEDIGIFIDRNPDPEARALNEAFDEQTSLLEVAPVTPPVRVRAASASPPHRPSLAPAVPVASPLVARSWHCHCGRSLPASVSATSSSGPTCADVPLRCFSRRKRARIS